LECRLLDTAEAVFLELGYTRATIDAIAKAAGATRKTIYARYANKGRSSMPRFGGCWMPVCRCRLCGRVSGREIRARFCSSWPRT
jgi:hypothetical protein